MCRIRRWIGWQWFKFRIRLLHLFNMSPAYESGATCAVWRCWHERVWPERSPLVCKDWFRRHFLKV